MQKLTFLFLLSFCSLSLYGQGLYTIEHREGEIPVIGILRSPDNMYDVARYPGSHLGFSCAVKTGTNPGEILAAYIKTDSLRSIEMTRSMDGGRSWKPERFPIHWDGEHFRSLSMFNMGTPYLHHRRGRKNDVPRNNLMLFSGGNPIIISSSYTNGEQWCNFYPANTFGGFRISGLVQLNDGRHMALFHDDGRFLYDDGQSASLRKSAIYKMYSSDGGLTWSEPHVAIKHNLYGLYDAAVVYSPARKDDTLIMIASERETCESYISFSSDNGDNWSYPAKLPHFIHGDRFGIATLRSQLLISFRDMCRTRQDGSPNPTYGDLVLWTGDLRELIKGNSKSGIKVQIADTYPTDEPVDYNDRKFSDCGYPSVLPLPRNEVMIIAYGRWEKDHEPFVRSFPINTMVIQQYAKKLW